MEKRLGLILLVLFMHFLLGSEAFGQAGDSLDEKREVVFEGLKRTRQGYIQRFVSPGLYEKTDIKLIQQSARQILNTGFFSEVNYRIDSIQEQERIVFQVKEKWTMLPSFNGGLSDRHSWFELGVIDYHFRGVGGRLGLYYRYYGKSAFQFFINQPYIGKSRWGYDLLAENYIDRENVYFPSLDYKYRLERYHFYLLGSRELMGINRSIQFGLGYLSENYVLDDSLLVSGQNVPVKEKQDAVYAVFKWVDNSKVKQDVLYQQGFGYSFFVEAPFFSISKNNYARIGLENRCYLKIGKKGNMAGRMRFFWVENHTAPFAPLIQDDFKNLRGGGHCSGRGTAELSLNIEHRQTFWDKPWLAMQFIVFTDISSLRPPGASLASWIDNHNLKYFAGPGIRLNFKRISGFILRADYGFSITDNNRGLVLGVNHFF